MAESTSSLPERRLAWGILGTGRIAHTFAKGLASSRTGRLLAVGSRSAEAAAAFGDEFQAPRRYASYEALLADAEVDAVYIALPNHLHAPWTVRAAEAGKHILCEKPLASNLGEAMIAVEAARANGVFLMEAFMYRCHPQTHKLAELVRSGAVGEVRVLQVNFSFDWKAPRYDNVRQQSAMGGGGIMDVGCYCLSMSRLLAGAALGRDFVEPLEIKAVAHVDPQSRVDQWSSAVCRFPGGITATLSCGLRARVTAGVSVWGSEGHIQVSAPWFPGEKGSEILLYRDGQAEPERIVVDADEPLYAIEADTVARHLAAGQAPAPCMSWADSLGNMQALDRWRKDLGLVFDHETPSAMAAPAALRPKVYGSPPAMPYGRVEGIEQPISRLVMGTMVLRENGLPFACALLDHFVELGGNCLDTAYVYQTEAIVGQWLKARNNRRDVVLIAKGAHTPHCTPEGLTRQLFETLDRFGTDSVDLYFMHRDNPQVPVDEFVDVLNEHLRAGRIRAFGGSNWTVERIEAANAYAAQYGLRGFTANSPNFCLAVWNEPMWKGCVAAVDPASRAWHQRTQMPLFAWSSQASGLFTGRFRPEDRDNPAIAPVVRTWFNEANFERLERVKALAARKGVTSTQVALAYVLCQPLNIFALIGPRSIEETRTSVAALELALTPDELRWLNLED